MPREREGVQEQLQALAAVLTAVRGRLGELSGRLPDEEPSAEGQETKPGLKSILSCVLRDSLEPAIRDLLLAVDEAAPAADEGGGGTAYQHVLSRLGEALPRLLAKREKEQRELADLARQLEASTAEERTAALDDPRFHRLELVEQLLAESASALPEDLPRAEDLAGLAAAVAGRLADPADTMDGRARAACRLANARRLAGDHAAAALAISDARYLEGGEAIAEVCRTLALLRWEEGRMEEAAALLERAVEYWAEEEVSHDEGACHVLRALLLVDQGRAKEAVHLLRDELPLLVDPWLTLYGGLGLALGLAEQGLVERARTVRDESAGFVHRTPAAAYLYALHLEGEISASLGEPEDAAQLLEELRREALTLRWPVEAAVATLALASLDLERGASDETARARAAELEATFETTQGLAGVLAALRDFPRQAAPGESAHELATALGATFRRLLRLQGVRSAPLPFT